MALGSGILAGLGDNRVAFVSRDDLGEGHAGAIYNATGPAALSGPERAAVLTETTGKPMHYKIFDEVQLRGWMAQAGVPQEYIGALIDIEKRFIAGDFNIVTGDIERLAGRRPRTLREVLAVSQS